MRLPPLSPALRASVMLHAGALAAAAVAPARWPWWIGTLFADHVFLFAAGMWPRSRLLGPNLWRLPAGAGAAVALTFDDGPEPGVTERVLDQLDRARAPATFFCIGRRARRHAALVREIAARGHEVANHTDEHSYLFAMQGPAKLQRDLERAQATLTELAGRRPTRFRAPAGVRSPLLDPVLRRLGLELVSWSRRGFDAVDRDPGAITRRLTSGLAPGAILLLHDGVLHRRGTPAPVLEVLPRLLDEIARRSLRIVPLPGFTRARSHHTR